MTLTYVMRARLGFPISCSTWKAYLPLFRQLSEFRMLYVSRTDAHFHRATEIFDSLVKIPLESDIAEDLLRYFRVRKCGTKSDTTTVTDAELIFRNEARGTVSKAKYLRDCIDAGKSARSATLPSREFCIE